MAINLLAIISIVFVIFAGAIVALFVLHFKHKPKSTLPAQVATNAEDVSNLQTNVASLKSTVTDLQSGKGQSWGDWTINHTEGSKTAGSEFQICYNGKVQLNLSKQIPDIDTVASKLWVQNFATDHIDTTSLSSYNTIETNPKEGTKQNQKIKPVIVGVDTPHKNKWNSFPCGGGF